MIAAAFKEMHEESLEDRLEKELSGDFLRLMIATVQGARREDEPLDANKAKEDAAALYEAGELKYGTDESTFTRVLVRNSYSQLHAVNMAYQELAGKTLEEAVEAELSGYMLKAAKTILGVAKNKDEFWAQRLHSCMAGLGTDDKALINILVARSEIDLGNIKREFQKIYEKSLEAWIEGESSGDYKKMLLEIVATE
jgi:annexin A7/11